MKNKTKFKVGDWVKPNLVGISREGGAAYQVEAINGDEYVIVQKEGSYTHKMTVKEKQLNIL